MLQARNIAVRYQLYRNIFRRSEYWALQDISFDLLQGECLGVIGRNGVGKTTLLNVIAGIIKPDRGTITPQHRSASLLSPQIGFMGYLTGQENAILGGMLLGLRKHEILDRLPEIEAFADIGEFFHQPLSTYSSGMRARLGFSVAVSIHPEIILLDELLGVGDDDFKKKSSERIIQLIKSDRTVILVSHQLSQVVAFCNRVLWIENGRAKAFGNSRQVVREYYDFCKRHSIGPGKPAGPGRVSLADHAAALEFGDERADAAIRSADGDEKR